MYAIIYKHYECAVLAGVAEQADAADLKSADTRVSYRFKSGHRHHTVPKDNRQIQYRGVEQLVARRAHNPEAVWFKSHLRNQEAVPKKMPPRKLEVSSSFLRFSPFFSFFQNSKVNAIKKMTFPFSKYREGLEP